MYQRKKQLNKRTFDRLSQHPEAISIYGYYRFPDDLYTAHQVQEGFRLGEFCYVKMDCKSVSSQRVGGAVEHKSCYVRYYVGEGEPRNDWFAYVEVATRAAF